MSANIDTMLYVKETPWHGLGHRYEEAPATPAEIIAGAELGWEVADSPMKTDIHDKVLNYSAIYRTDSNAVLGVVNKANIVHVQNADTFNAFETILNNEVTVDTAASIDRGATVFGCFKISDTYKVLDDDIEHYFVVVNDHLKCDGKVTILNTPIRVVCQNTLNAALSSSSAKIRIPLSTEPAINAEIARKIIDSAAASIDFLGIQAEKLVKEKVSRSYIDILLDKLFPYVEDDGITEKHERTNARIDMMRETFVDDCLGADNLSNYNGTKYQVLQAVLDYSQHYYTNADKSYDLKYRMGAVFGSSDTTTPMGMTAKFLKICDKIAA